MLLVSTVFGTVSSLHPTSFLYLFHLSGLTARPLRVCVRSKTEVVTYTCNQDKMASV